MHKKGTHWCIIATVQIIPRITQCELHTQSIRVLSYTRKIHRENSRLSGHTSWNKIICHAHAMHRTPSSVTLCTVVRLVQFSYVPYSDGFLFIILDPVLSPICCMIVYYDYRRLVNRQLFFGRIKFLNSFWVVSSIDGRLIAESRGNPQ